MMSEASPVIARAAGGARAQTGYRAAELGHGFWHPGILAELPGRASRVGANRAPHERLRWRPASTRAIASIASSIPLCGELCSTRAG
jgi:hypothetical protein